MSSKKRPRPLFEVPVEIGSARESGWVYRSDAAQDEPRRPHDEPRRPRVATESEIETNLVAMSAQALGLALATVTTTFLLSVAITALPVTMSIRVLQSVANKSS